MFVLRGVLLYSDGAWTNAPLLDLSPYAGQRVQIGFDFQSSHWFGNSPPDTAAGWYLDEVTVMTDLTLRIDSLIVRTQILSSVPLTLYCSYDLNEMEFTVRVPPGHLSNVSLTNVDATLTPTLQAQSDGQWRFRMRGNQPGALTGVKEMARFQFTAVSTRSVIVPISLIDVLGVTAAGSLVTNWLGLNGRLVIIASQPMLEMTPGQTAEPLLTVYGVPGTTNLVESALDLVDSLSNPSAQTQWRPDFRVVISTSFFEVRQINATNRSTFYRAVVE